MTILIDFVKCMVFGITSRPYEIVKNFILDEGKDDIAKTLCILDFLEEDAEVLLRCYKKNEYEFNKMIKTTGYDYTMRFNCMREMYPIYSMASANITYYKKPSEKFSYCLFELTKDEDPLLFLELLEL